MAEIAKNGNPSIASILPPANDKITGLYAGENIAIGDACYIKTADGKVYRSTGAAAGAAAVVDGFAFVAANAGEAVTLIRSVVVAYGSALSPGSFVYLSGVTVGGLADAASVGGTTPIGRVIDATRIFLQKSY